MKRQLRQFGTALAIVMALVPAVVAAQVMTSTNYKIPSDDLSGGGGYSTSTNYKLTDTVAEQSSPTGEGMASTNYRACAGFECLDTTAFLTADVTTSSSPCTTSSTSTPPFNIALGTLSLGAVTTATNHVCIRATTNVSVPVVVTVRDAYGALRSASKPTDLITSATATLAAAFQGYGVCATNASGFTASSPYNGSCDATHHVVGKLQTTAQPIFTQTGPFTNSYGDVLTKASISLTTPGQGDYADVLTYVVTATY